MKKFSELLQELDSNKKVGKSNIWNKYDVPIEDAFSEDEQLAGTKEQPDKGDVVVSIDANGKFSACIFGEKCNKAAQKFSNEADAVLSVKDRAKSNVVWLRTIDGKYERATYDLNDIDEDEINFYD